MDRVCVVCSGPTKGYNYGVLTCNACKMFFQRVIVKNDLKDCNSRTGNCRNNCMFCRFSKCLNAGMTHDPFSHIHDFQSNDVIIPVVIKNLIYLDNRRKSLLRDSYFDGDPSAPEITNEFIFIEKPSDYRMGYRDWGFLNSITGIDFLKKINFMRHLEAGDQSIILKHFFIQFGLFCIAQTSYESNQGNLTFPDGMEIPESNVTGVSGSLRTRIQSRMIAKLIELRVTREEFLLLSVVFLCNPGVLGLSDVGKTTVTYQQNYYSSALLQRCLLGHQKSGPSRFTDLIFLYQVISQTFDDLAAHYQLRKLYNSEVHSKRIFIPDD